MELIEGTFNKPTGLVVFMVEKGKGLVVSVGPTNQNWHKGLWSTKWHSNLKHSRTALNSEYWSLFTGTITLEND